MKVALFTGLILIQTVWSIFIRHGVAVNQGLSPVKINLNQYKKISNSFTTTSGTIKYKYQQQYKGVDIFGATLVIEQDTKDSTQFKPIFGHYYETSAIKDDFNDDVTPSITEDIALQIAISHYIANGDKTDLFGYSYGEDDRKCKLTLYKDEQHNINKYYLSYIVQFSYQDQSTQDVYRAFIVIDAKTGDILYTFSSIISKRSGDNAWGIGGNKKVGEIQHGPLPIDAAPDVKNEYVHVYNCKNDYSLGQCEMILDKCEIQDVEINTAPNCIADAYSYGNVVFNLYRDWGPPDVLPLAPDKMPLRLYVHYGDEYENAFWTGSAVYFGDGKDIFYPLTALDVTAHEVAHGFTDQGSDLIYSDQSGGMNEAYSDLAGEAAEAYEREVTDWGTGYDIFKDPKRALRYLYDPPLDGFSIDHVDYYVDRMNVHFSSGIYNKGWYLLSTQNGEYDWNIKDIFLMASTANLYYWTASSTFNEGVCGMQDAACDVFPNNECEGRKRDIALAWQGQGVLCDPVTNAINIHKADMPSNTNNDNNNNMNELVIYGGVASGIFVIFIIVFSICFYRKSVKKLNNKSNIGGDDNNLYGAIVTNDGRI